MPNDFDRRGDLDTSNAGWLRQLLAIIAVLAAVAVALTLAWPLLAGLWQRLRNEIGVPLPAVIAIAASLLTIAATAWQRRRRRLARQQQADDGFTLAVESGSAKRRRRDDRTPAGCLWGPALFLVVGLAFSLVFVLPAVKSLRALDWQQTDCQILASSVASHSGEDGVTYNVEVTYRYQFDGVEYTSDRYRFLGGSSSGREGKQRVVDSLPPGSATTCWVNPEDPSDAVLDRGLSWEYAFVLLPLIFVLLGAAGLVLALRARAAQEKGASAETAITEAMRPFAGDKRNVLPEPVAGPLELEASATPLGKLLGVTFFAAIWNGIVGVFVWQMVREPDLFLGCFLVPFVLVGLMLLLGIPYQALALANPRPHLKLIEQRLFPGASTTLHWHFTGAVRRLRNLKIVLECRETATYRSGDSSSSTTATVARVDLVDQSQTGLVGQGNVLVQIPGEAMHSFSGRRNRIVWVLTLSAGIARWPDVREEFEIAVLPEVSS